MNTNSNSYTIIYASVMVIIVAFLLAFLSCVAFSEELTNARRNATIITITEA